MQLPTRKLCTGESAHHSTFNGFLNTVILGDCCVVMQQFPSSSIDFIFTDPPYLVNYHPRDGRTIGGDKDDSWLFPAFAEAGRVLKPDRFCISFFGWAKTDRYFAAWRKAGFRPVGHLVWIKPYTSGST